MKKPHTKARGILFAAAGMFLIPGSVSEVSAAERKDEQPFIQASGIESVLEKCYETEVKDNINLYLVPTEEGEYLNMAFSDTKEFTYIRNAPDDSGDWVGKLYKDSAAQVLEYLDGWTKIRSGSAEGYVPEDALFTGEEAQARAQEYEKDTVTVTAYVLNVREGCGTDSKILTQIKKGEVYETVGEATGGWYPVKVGDKSGWVSGDYVIAETSYSYGETKEEEEDYYVGMGEYGGVDVTKETMDAFMQQIRTAVDDKEAFAKLMDYPVKINYEAGSVTVNNEKEMLEKYDTLMSTNYFKENVKEIFVGSYPFYNYMGVMMEIGEQGQNVWIDQDKNGTLGIYAINAG